MDITTMNDLDCDILMVLIKSLIKFLSYQSNLIRLLKRLYTVPLNRFQEKMISYDTVNVDGITYSCRKLTFSKHTARRFVNANYFFRTLATYRDKHRRLLLDVEVSEVRYILSDISHNSRLSRPFCTKNSQTKRFLHEGRLVKEKTSGRIVQSYRQYRSVHKFTCWGKYR